MGVIFVVKAIPHPSDSTKIRVTFSEPFVVLDAETAGNYVFTPTLTVTSSTTVSGTSNTQVDLVISTAITKGTYSLQVSSVRDAATNTLITAGNGLALLNYFYSNSLKTISVTGGFKVLLPRTLNSWLGSNGVPIPPPPEFKITSVTPSPTHLDLVFNSAIATLSLNAALPENWIFQPTSGVGIQATSLQVMSNVLRIFTTEGLGGDTCSLVIPVNGLKSITNVLYTGNASISFTVSATKPTISIVQSINSTSIRIVFSEAVIESDALLASNYSVAPPLTIISAQKETQNTYILTTSVQTPLQSYTLTVSNIRDASHNPI